MGIQARQRLCNRSGQSIDLADARSKWLRLFSVCREIIDRGLLRQMQNRYDEIDPIDLLKPFLRIHQVQFHVGPTQKRFRDNPGSFLRLGSELT